MSLSKQIIWPNHERVMRVLVPLVLILLKLVVAVDYVVVTTVAEAKPRSYRL